MGTPVLILGESGSGKSASLRKLASTNVFLINVAGKRLPFRGKFKELKSDSYVTIIQQMCKAAVAGIKVIVVDDAQYLMANEFMRNAKATGYQKFTDIAQNFWSLIKAAEGLPNDVLIYFLCHTMRSDDGIEKIKTIGKMLDEKITLEGMFTIVLKTVVNDGKYMFSTQTNGCDTVKSPMGMFDALEIDNDLAMVDATIREYYELPALEAPKKNQEEEETA